MLEITESVDLLSEDRERLSHRGRLEIYVTGTLKIIKAVVSTCKSIVKTDVVCMKSF